MSIRYPVEAFLGIATTAYDRLARLWEWTRRLG
jgi:hypothetical protein